MEIENIKIRRNKDVGTLRLRGAQDSYIKKGESTTESETTDRHGSFVCNGLSRSSVEDKDAH